MPSGVAASTLDVLNPTRSVTVDMIMVQFLSAILYNSCNHIVQRSIFRFFYCVLLDARHDSINYYAFNSIC